MKHIPFTGEQYNKYKGDIAKLSEKDFENLHGVVLMEFFRRRHSNFTPREEGGVRILTSKAKFVAKGSIVSNKLEMHSVEEFEFSKEELNPPTTGRVNIVTALPYCAPVGDSYIVNGTTYICTNLVNGIARWEIV